MRTPTKNLTLLMAALVLIALTSFEVAVGAEETNQKAVLVTGASSGIGLRIAETLAENGYYVYAGARKAEDLARLDAMDNVSAVRLDVTVQEDIDAAAAFVRAQGRGLWGVVNNAGIVVLSPLATGPEDDLQLTFDVNVFGPFRVNQAFLPLLTESRGRTTTIGSISGFLAGPGSSYGMSKFAVEGYTDSLAEEIAESGVHVSVVDPGGYKSRIREKMAAQIEAAPEIAGADLSEEERAEMIKTNMGNADLKEPDAVAAAVLHVMGSDEPRRRYMVTPNEMQARITITSALQRVVELNTEQPYSYDRDELIALLDELLGTEKAE